MEQRSVSEWLTRPGCILGEGAVIERLNRTDGIELDPVLVNSAFIYAPATRRAIEDIYREYLDIGLRYQLPLFLSTPTWRASRGRIEQTAYAGQDVNRDNYLFLDALRQSYGDYGRKVIISGLMSCRGDAYDPSQALTTRDAREYHAWQANQLAASGVDVLLAATLPAISEALGLAEAMSATGVPYLVSFVARPEGTMLDGTPLKDVIARIDAEVSPRPLAFLVNCTHASIFKAAVLNDENSSQTVRERIVGLLANTAALTPEELNNSTELKEEDPEVFGASMAALHTDLGLKLLGGCCGTDDRHIRELAARLADH